MSVDGTIEKVSKLLPGLPVCLLAAIRVLEVWGKAIFTPITADAQNLDLMKAFGSAVSALVVIAMVAAVMLLSEVLHVAALYFLMLLGRVERVKWASYLIWPFFSTKAVNDFGDDERNRALQKYVNYYAVALGCGVSVVLELFLWEKAAYTLSVTLVLAVAGLTMMLYARLVATSMGKNFYRP